MRRRKTLCAAVLLAVMGCSAGDSSDRTVRIQLDDSGASFPTTAVDDRNGLVYWAWFDKDDRDSNTVVVSHFTSSAGEVSGPIAIDRGGHAVNVHAQAPPQVEVAPDGDVLVAWSSSVPIEGRRFPASHVLLSVSRNGGRTFDPPVIVNDDFGGKPAGHTFHDLEVGPDGTVYVSWLDSRASRHRPDVEGNENRHAVHDEFLPGVVQTAVREGQEGSHAASSGTSVRIAASTDGGRTFGASVVVAEGTCQCCRTALFVDRDGDVYVAWRHIFGANMRDIALSRSIDGGRTFSPPTRVHADGWAIDGCPHNGPSVAVTRDDAVHVTWYTAAEGRIGLYRAVSPNDGRSFDPPEGLIRNVPNASARVAAGDGDVWIAWEDPRKGRFEVVSEERAVGSFIGSAPSIAVGAELASVAWQHDGGVYGAVYDAVQEE